MRFLFFFVFLFSLLSSAFGQNLNCGLTVPNRPLSDIGLKTPYLLSGTNSVLYGQCNQVNPAQTAFVQGALFDQKNNQIYIYNPLVIDVGSNPAIAPPLPPFPSDNVIVGLWFGFNGKQLTLIDDGAGSLMQGHCVNVAGSDSSLFGNFAYCNAPEFFAAVNHAINFGRYTVPIPGQSSKDNLPCPTIRDWLMADAFGATGVTTRYLVSQGLLAQDTLANRQALGIGNAQLSGTVLSQSASSNSLLVDRVLPLLSCRPFTALDLASLAQGQQQFVSGLPLNALSAAQHQRAPFALIFANNPLTMVAGGTAFDIQKVNSLRIGLNQPTAGQVNGEADPISACNRLYAVTAPRIMLDAPYFKLTNSPNVAVASTLFGYMVWRTNQAAMAGNMNCEGLLNMPLPFTYNLINGAVDENTVQISTPQITRLTGFSIDSFPPQFAGVIRLSPNTVLNEHAGNGDLPAVGAEITMNLLNQQTPNPNCNLVVPPFPLSQAGLAIPYRLTASNPSVGGPCSMSNPQQRVYAQGALFDVMTNTPYVYNPLVIDDGATPAVPPVPPSIPVPSTFANVIVGLWFSFAGSQLTLVDDGTGSLQAGNCVSGGGSDNSVFGNFAYCNAVEFFDIVENAIETGALTVPPLGRGSDGDLCPTVRDFWVVGANQGINVLTQYLYSNGQVAQDTPSNRRFLGIFQENWGINVINDPDSRLIQILNDVYGCKPWLATDLASRSQSGEVSGLAALPFEEIFARHRTNAPQALVPANAPMTQTWGGLKPDVRKVNALRLGLNQPVIGKLDWANGKNYCLRLYNVAPQRLMEDRLMLTRAKSPDHTKANNLFDYLVQRLNTAAALLRCTESDTKPYGGFVERPLPFTYRLLPNGQVDTSTVVWNPASRITTVTPTMLVLSANAMQDIENGHGDMVTAPSKSSGCPSLFTAGDFNGAWFGIGFFLASVGSMIIAGVSLCAKARASNVFHNLK